MPLQPPTAAQAYAAALTCASGDKPTQNKERIRTFINFIGLNDQRLDEETVREYVREIYHRHFSWNSGGFALARRFRETLTDPRPTHTERTRKLLRAALVEVSILMCRNLESAHQSGHIAGNSIEIARWCAEYIAVDDRMAANRLMRTCGKSLSGPFVDALFWELVTRQDVFRHDFLEPLAEGMLAAEGVAGILSRHLNESSRSKEVSDLAVEAYRQRQAS